MKDETPSRQLLLLAIAALVSCCASVGQAASPDDTRLGSATGSIVDSTGAKWTLSGGYIYVNGTRDVHSANVVCLAYEDGRVWQENASHMWYMKTKPSDTWAPSGGDADSPLPSITAVIASGYMKIRTDPQVVVGITAIGSNSTYLGSLSVVADSIGNASVPTSSLFGHSTYLLSEFKRPMMLSRDADIAMFSIEKFTGLAYGGDGYYGDYVYGDLKSTYGTRVDYLDWTSLVRLQTASPAVFTAFSKSLGSDQAYTFFNGNQYDQNLALYVVKTYQTATTVASIAGQLFLDTDNVGQGRVAYFNYGVDGYKLNSSESIQVIVP